MRIRRTTFSAAVAAGLAAIPLSTTKAQDYTQQRQPTAKGTTDQLNREELTRLQSGNGYSPYYWASGSPVGIGLSMGWSWGYPACSSPFPLFWPFCVVGAVLGTAGIIVSAPFQALTGAPPLYYGYYGPPYYPLPNYYGPRRACPSRAGRSGVNPLSPSGCRCSRGRVHLRRRHGLAKDYPDSEFARKYGGFV